MLIVLDDDLISNAVPNAVPDDDVFAMLDVVAHNRRMGNHILYASRGALEYFLASAQASQITRAVLSKVRSRLPQKMSFYSQVNRRLRVTKRAHTFTSQNVGACQELVISADVLRDPQLSGKCVLLAENQNDIFFYSRLAEIAATFAKWGNVSIRCEGRGGGGNTLAEEYLVLQNAQNRLCFCISDSDKKYPAGALGQTAQRVVDANDLLVPTTEYYILQVREIENMVSPKLYESMNDRDAQRQHVVATLIRVEQHSQTVLDHFDMKDGLNLCELDTGNDFSNWWNHELELLRNAGIPLIAECINPGSANDSCQCYVLRGFGQNVLKNFNSVIMEKQSAHHIFSNLSIRHRNLWTELGCLIASWCCGSERIIA